MTSTVTRSQEVKSSERDRRILCFHMNVTSRIQIIRVTSSNGMPLERVIFPMQRLLFEALPEANVEIQINDVASIIVPCTQLQVAES